MAKCVRKPCCHAWIIYRRIPCLQVTTLGTLEHLHDTRKKDYEQADLIVDTDDYLCQSLDKVLNSLNEE